MSGSIREMSGEMGDNHVNFDLFRLDSSVRIKTPISTDYFQIFYVYSKHKYLWSDEAVLNLLFKLQPFGYFAK